MAEPLTEEQLAEIEGRADAATPETWVWSWSTGWSTDGLGHYLVETARSRIVVAITTREKQGYENALFIAHARTDVPLLVAEVRRLREVLGAIAQYHPTFRGQRVNDAPNRQQLVDRAFAALDHREGE